MSGLYSGATVRELIPGDPGLLQTLASSMTVVATGLDHAAEELNAINSGSWTGRAADSFKHVLHQQPGRYAQASAAFGQAAGAVNAYASALEAAQRQAGTAITRWEDAEAASAGWRQRCDAARSASQPITEHRDPGDDGRSSAQQILNGAHAELDAAAAQLRSTLDAARGGAPTRPSLFGQLVTDIEKFLASHGEDVAGLTALYKIATALRGVAGAGDFAEFARLAAEWDAIAPGSPIAQEAERLFFEHFPGATAVEAAGHALEHVPVGGKYADFLTDATRFGPWLKGLGIAGGVFGTAEGVYNVAEDIGHHASGLQTATDVSGTAFSASTTALLIAPNPFTVGAVVITGGVFAGLEAWQNRDAIEHFTGTVLHAAWDSSVPGMLWNNRDEIGNVLQHGADLGGSIVHGAAHAIESIL